jgi:ERCC4-type nuclease
MPVRFILDTRETGLQEFFRVNKVPCEVKQLDLGDIVILYSKGEIRVPTSGRTDESSEPMSSSARSLLRGGGSKAEEKIEDTEDTKDPTHAIVLERKSYTDLKASIIDGRYHEQKARYMKLPRGTMYYILENNDPRFQSLERKQYLGAYLHTMIRDDLKVFHTENMADTYEFILGIGRALEEFGVNYRENPDGGRCTMKDTQIKKKGKDGSVYERQLSCFPGISSAKAKVIAGVYPTMKILMIALENGSFKIKGIGPKLTENLKEGLNMGAATVHPRARIVFGEE